MEDHFIPGIFNYCDRWCARCEFTRRCRIFVEDAAMTEAQREIGSEAYWEFLDQQIQGALDGVREKVEDLGGQWHKLKEEARQLGMDARKLSEAQELLRQSAVQYAEKTQAWFHHFEPVLEAYHAQRDHVPARKEEFLRLQDALETIRWFMVFIGIKIDRALHALHSEWEGPATKVQGDANGSAKITLIAVNRSLKAWETLAKSFPEHQDQMLDMLRLLERMRKGLHLHFPRAKHFIRPGFDQAMVGDGPRGSG